MLIASLALAPTNWLYLEFREVEDTEAAENWFGKDLPILLTEGIPADFTLLQPNKLLYETPTILIVETHPFADQVYRAIDEQTNQFQIAIDYLEGFDDPIALGIFFRDRADLDEFVATGYAKLGPQGI